MASAKSNDCLVGCEVVQDRIRIAVLTTGNAGHTATGDTAPLQGNTAPLQGVSCLRFEEIVLPDAEAPAPGISPTCGALPPASDLAPLIKEAAARLDIGGGRAAVALGASRMVLRYFVGSDEQVRTELQRATERSIGYVQFGMGDRVVGEHIHQLKDGRSHGLLGVSSAATIDSLTKALEQVGLRSVLVESTLVATMRLAGATGRLNDDDTLLILVMEGGMEIGVVAAGHVLLARRILSAADRSDESPATQHPIDLTRELQKVSRHYMRTFGTAGEVHRILFCGAGDLVGRSTEELRDGEDFQAVQLSVDQSVIERLGMRCDDLESKDSYAPALGAAMGLLNDYCDPIGPNLTSEVELRRRTPLEMLFRAAMVPTLVALGIWGTVQLTQGHLERAVAQMRTQADHPSPDETKHRDLKMQLTQTQQRRIRLERLVGKFHERDSRRLMEIVRICVPDRLWLTRVRLQSDSLVTVEGAAYDESLIYHFREDLEGSPLFQSVTIISTTNSRQNNVIMAEFSLECTIASKGQVPSNPSEPTDVQALTGKSDGTVRD